MVSPPSHYDRNRLRMLLEDRLPILERERATKHLETCEACRREFESLAAGSQWWKESRDFLQNDSCPPRDAVVSSRENAAPTAEDSQHLEFQSLWFLTPSGMPESLGRLGEYEVLKCIGRGGMGIVLKALDPELDRYVAIKVLAPEWGANGQARKRFVREAQAGAAVAHPHVVPIYAVDADARLPYLVMAFVQGLSLQQRLDRSGALESIDSLRIGRQIAAGLAAAHAQGLVHRDIKPANILLENGVERVLITDFGLAQAADDASMTVSGFIAGTPHYVSPEQARGERVDCRSDLFSLGAVLYAMCTGHPPFRAENTMAVLRRVCETPHRPVREVNPDVLSGLAQIIDRLLAKAPQSRFSSADEVAEIVGRYLAHLQQANGLSEYPPYQESLLLQWDNQPPQTSARHRADQSMASGQQSSAAGFKRPLAKAAAFLAATLAIATAGYAAAFIFIADEPRQQTGAAPVQDTPVALPTRTSEEQTVLPVQPIEAGKFRSEFAYDFRNRAFDARSFPPVGTTSLFGLRLLKPEPEGLRITIPAAQGNQKPNIGVAPAAEIVGDFEITASYELMTAELPARGSGAGANLYILPKDARSGATFRRCLSPNGEAAYLLVWPEKENARQTLQSARFPAEGSTGKLRLVRTAASLQFSVAEGESGFFHTLHECEFNTDPIGLFRMEANTGGANAALDLRWKDVRIRAEAVRPLELPLFHSPRSGQRLSPERQNH